MIVILSNGVYASEETSKVVISFDLTSEDRFIYEVRVSTGGYLLDGSQKIVDGIMEYELSVGQTKEFILVANKGYEVKEIKVNNQNLDTNLKKVRITGVSGRSVLEIRYGKIEELLVPDTPTPPDNMVIPDGSQSGENGGLDYIDTNRENGVDSLIPITGDMLRISEYICLMLIILYRIYVSGRGINTQQRDDNIAILKNIEENKETLKEEKKDEK